MESVFHWVNEYRSVLGPFKLDSCGIDDGFGSEAKVLHQFIGRGGQAEVLLAYDGAAEANVLFPTHSDSGFNGDSGLHIRRKNLAAVFVILAIEEFAAGHGDHTRSDTFLR